MDDEIKHELGAACSTHGPYETKTKFQLGPLELTRGYITMELKGVGCITYQGHRKETVLFMV